MLELRPNCECCDRDLPPDSPDAMICTYECTWCRDCTEGVLGGVCPNCDGNLERRPIRPAALLGRHPASAERVVRERCPDQSAWRCVSNPALAMWADSGCLCTAD